MARLVANKLDTLVEMSDSELSKVVRPAYRNQRGYNVPPSVEVTVSYRPATAIVDTEFKVTIFLDRLDDYLKGFRENPIKRFEWVQYKGSDQFMLFGKPVVSDDIRPFCQVGYKDGDECSAIVATRRLKAITGIIGSDALKQAEFQTEIIPTEMGQRLFKQSPQIENHVARFLLYDDGWRIAN